MTRQKWILDILMNAVVYSFNGNRSKIIDLAALQNLAIM